jgi:hypothetical protein
VNDLIVVIIWREVNIHIGWENGSVWWTFLWITVVQRSRFPSILLSNNIILTAKLISSAKSTLYTVVRIELISTDKKRIRVAVARQAKHFRIWFRNWYLVLVRWHKKAIMIAKMIRTKEEFSLMVSFGTKKLIAGRKSMAVYIFGKFYYIKSELLYQIVRKIIPARNIIEVLTFFHKFWFYPRKQDI